MLRIRENKKLITFKDELPIKKMDNKNGGKGGKVGGSERAFDF